MGRNDGGGLVAGLGTGGFLLELILGFVVSFSPLTPSLLGELVEETLVVFFLGDARLGVFDHGGSFQNVVLLVGPLGNVNVIDLVPDPLAISVRQRLGNVTSGAPPRNMAPPRDPGDATEGSRGVPLSLPVVLLFQLLGFHLYGIHPFTQLTQPVAGGDVLPHLALQLEFRLLALKLPLQLIHQSLAVQDALHLGHLGFRQWPAFLLGQPHLLGGSGVGRVLGVAEHEVQLPGFQFALLHLGGVRHLDLVELGLEPVVLAALDVDDLGLLVQLALQLCD